MAQLAIKGHQTRGKELIEILEMLGGKRKGNLRGNEIFYWYYIDQSGYINYKHYSLFDSIKVFTLEEFLEKLPYKVGDKVVDKCGINGIIEKILWEQELNCVRYQVSYYNKPYDTSWWIAIELQPYKEETMDIPNKLKPVIDLSSYSKDEYIIKLGDYEIKEIDGVLKAIRKQPQYPKTYEECHKILGVGEREVLFDGATASEEYLFDSFLKLKRCRDAYWKIAGDWKPDFTNDDEERYGMYTAANKVVKDFCGVGDVNIILTFPTEEMRDSFYENFKELIEQCKELL